MFMNVSVNIIFHFTSILNVKGHGILHLLHSHW